MVYFCKLDNNIWLISQFKRNQTKFFYYTFPTNFITVVLKYKISKKQGVDIYTYLSLPNRYCHYKTSNLECEVIERARIIKSGGTTYLEKFSKRRSGQCA